MSTATIQIPRLIFVEDYQDFPSLATQFSIATGKDLSITELGFHPEHGYIGALHEGTASPEDFDNLISETGITLEGE